MSRRTHRDAARGQRVCAVTGRAGPWHPHHAVREQDVPDGCDPHDPRNALRVLVAFHFNHHQAARRIPLTALTEGNLEYAFEVLGAYAPDYLYRHYVGEDLRVEDLRVAVLTNG